MPRNSVISQTEPQALIIGCGDIGRRVAALERAAGHGVMALARSNASASHLLAANIAICRGDLDEPASLVGLPSDVSVLYYFAPPPPTDIGDPRLAALLEAVVPGREPERLVYISTSGVYGDCQGAWVNEDWPLTPLSDRARRRLAAERLVQEWGRKTGTAVVTLRVPGIYGPGRLPIERIRAGTPVVREQEAPFSNRIHADDLARACFAAALRGRPDQAYNVSDGHPTTMTDFFFRVADALHLPRPPEISLSEAHRCLGPGILSFLEESKRLDNRKMIEELGADIQFPDLGCGLPTCL